MSTRSQIRFTQTIEYETQECKTETTERIAQVYRHSDGYPESVLPALSDLKTMQDESRTHRDPSYTAANFIFLSKLQGMGLYVDRDGGYGGSLRRRDIMALIQDNDVPSMASLDQPHFLLGYGVENPESGIHGDEEYLYVVELPDRTHREDPGDWTIRVSAHNGFPRWDGPTEDAFDRATWEYEGTLSEAVDALAVEPA
jgi:hypothetical protein